MTSEPIYLPSDRHTDLSLLTAQHHTLEQISNWVFKQPSPTQLEEMIMQDEFTLDVVIRYDNDLYLVYDVT